MKVSTSRIAVLFTVYVVFCKRASACSKDTNSSTADRLYVGVGVVLVNSRARLRYTTEHPAVQASGYSRKPYAYSCVPTTVRFLVSTAHLVKGAYYRISSFLIRYSEYYLLYLR